MKPLHQLCKAATPDHFQVQLPLSRIQFTVSGNISLLEGALVAGIKLRSSCRNGSCRSCLCKLSTGQIRYKIEWPGLSKDEKADGYILPCIAFAMTDLVLDELIVE
ncbi:hypothetical protein BH11PSE12_BH11PSE12_09950 [soil metagenome]